MNGLIWKDISDLPHKSCYVIGAIYEGTVDGIDDWTYLKLSWDSDHGFHDAYGRRPSIDLWAEIHPPDVIKLNLEPA